MSLNYLSVRISDGVRWYELNDSVKYRVEGSSFGETSTTFRRKTVESPYIGGRFLIHATEETVEENLVVYVYGQDQVDLEDNIQKVVSLFTQYQYFLEFVLDENRRRFTCEMADYSITRQRELIHNTMALISLRIPRIPEVVRTVDY